MRRTKYCMRIISHSHKNTTTFPNQHAPDSASSSTFYPIIDIHRSKFIAQSSYHSPPHPELELAKPSLNQRQHDSNSFHFHLPDTFSSILQDNPIPPPSTADGGQLEAAASGFDSRGSDSQTIDVAAVLDNEPTSTVDVDAKQIIPCM